MARTRYPEDFFQDDGRADLKKADWQTRLKAYERTARHLDRRETERRIILTETAIQDYSDSKEAFAAPILYITTFLGICIAFYSTIGPLLEKSFGSVIDTVNLLITMLMVVTAFLTVAQIIKILFFDNANRAIRRYQLYLKALKQRVAEDERTGSRRRSGTAGARRMSRGL